jgi:hypothetical protein
MFRVRATVLSPGQTSLGIYGCSGGQGYGLTGTVGYLNDLWEYIPTTNIWTWMSGSNVTNFHGTVGTAGTTSTNNVPGARYGAMSWTDSSGNLWLFGGSGYNGGPSAAGLLNDLWDYNPSVVRSTSKRIRVSDTGKRSGKRDPTLSRLEPAGPLHVPAGVSAIVVAGRDGAPAKRKAGLCVSPGCHHKLIPQEMLPTWWKRESTCGMHGVFIRALSCRLNTQVLSFRK